MSVESKKVNYFLLTLFGSYRKYARTIEINGTQIKTLYTHIHTHALSCNVGHVVTECADIVDLRNA